VRNHNNTATAKIEIEIEAEPPERRSREKQDEPMQPPWHAEVGQFLTHAAELCVQHGVDLDTFMKGAWSAYVEARPGMRDYLEEVQLRNQLDEIRKSGGMGEA
jgi:hypothetical protein